METPDATSPASAGKSTTKAPKQSKTQSPETKNTSSEGRTSTRRLAERSNENKNKEQLECMKPKISDKGKVSNSRENRPFTEDELLFVALHRVTADYKRLPEKEFTKIAAIMNRAFCEDCDWEAYEKRVNILKRKYNALLAEMEAEKEKEKLTGGAQTKGKGAASAEVKGKGKSEGKAQSDVAMDDAVDDERMQED